MKDVVFWLAGQFAGRLAVAYQSLTGMQAQIDAREAPSARPRPQDLIWCEPVSGVTDGMMWICVPQVVWGQVGRQVLEAAGLGDITDEDARSSFHELIQQSTSPLGQLMTARLQKEISVGPGREEHEPPADLAWIAVPLSPAGENWPPILFAPNAPLVQALTPASSRSHGEPEQRELQVQAGLPAGREGRNLDLLLEVELPAASLSGARRCG